MYRDTWLCTHTWLGPLGVNSAASTIRPATITKTRRTGSTEAIVVWIEVGVSNSELGSNNGTNAWEQFPSSDYYLSGSYKYLHPTSSLKDGLAVYISYPILLHKVIFNHRT
jgi:hypothetical protein